MTARQHVDALIRQFGGKFDDDLALDDQGVYVFAVGDDRECMISVAEDTDGVYFVVNVLAVVTDKPEALFKHLLILNFSDELTVGAALGLTEEGDQIVLRYTTVATTLDAAKFEMTIEKLVATAEELERPLSEWQSSSDDSGDTNECPMLRAEGLLNFA